MVDVLFLPILPLFACYPVICVALPCRGPRGPCLKLRRLRWNSPQAHCLSYEKRRPVEKQRKKTYPEKPSTRRTPTKAQILEDVGGTAAAQAVQMGREWRFWKQTKLRNEHYRRANPDAYIHSSTGQSPSTLLKHQQLRLLTVARRFYSMPLGHTGLWRW